MHLIAKFGLEIGRVRSIKICLQMCPLSCIQIIFFLIKQVPFVKVWILLMQVYNISSPQDLGLPLPRAAGRRETQVRGDLYKQGARQGDQSSKKWKYQIGKKFLIQTSLQIEEKYPRNNFIPRSFLTNPFQIPLRHDQIGNLVCLFFSWIFSFLANFRVFPGKTSCVQTHSIKQEWAYPLPTLCEKFFLRMALRNCASMAGFPEMEVNFHNYFRGFHSRMSWIWVKSVCKPYQTLPASSVHYRAGYCPE